jgi:nucleotide-binding universal stress UspA family protein
MYKKMLVLLDGSKLAEVVFSYAGELAGRLNLSIDLLHVCLPEEIQQLPMREAYLQHMVEKLTAKSKNQPIRVTGFVALGYPADEILKYSDDNAVDIIMLATHGSSGIRRWGLGGVADKVIHAAKVPIWLVPSSLHEAILNDTLPQRSILVPLDGSRLAEVVIPHIMELLAQRGVDTEIILINVARPPSSSTVKSEAQEHLFSESLASLKTTGEVYLHGIAERLRAEGIRVRVEQLFGQPAEEIVKYASEYHPRLIVMSAHGRSGFSRFVFSSVTENVLHRLQRTPLFLVKPGNHSPLDDEDHLTEVETDGEDRDR